MYWTLKESYIKAHGLGLGLPLDEFSFYLDRDRIDIAFDIRCSEDATHWRFALLDVPQHHLIAIGVDTGGAPLSLRAWQFVP
jgi:4'-phosphopantetheinyl transferase